MMFRKTLEDLRAATLAVVNAVLIAGLAVACGSGPNVTTDDQGSSANGEATSDDGEPGSSVDVTDLSGSSWTLRFGEGPGGEVVLVDGWPVTLTFDGDSLGGRAACNGYGGSFSVDGSMFTVEGLGREDAGCQADVQAAEQAYLAALTDVEFIDLVGDDLALSGPATELIFERNDLVPIDAVTGSLWLLETLINSEQNTDAQGDPAVLMLEADGTGSGGSGCRSFRGNYILSGNEIIFTDLGFEGDCPNTLQAQDSQVGAVIGDGFRADVNGDKLTLSSVGGEGLIYRRTSEDEVSSIPAGDVTSDAELLDGIVWTFLGGDSPDGPIADPRTIDPEATITLVLYPNSYEGTAVCNDYGGAAEVGSGQLSLTLPEGEEEGCGDDLQPTIDAFYRALPRMVEFGLESDGDRLVMNDGETEFWFERTG